LASATKNNDKASGTDRERGFFKRVSFARQLFQRVDRSHVSGSGRFDFAANGEGTEGKLRSVPAVDLKICRLNQIEVIAIKQISPGDAPATDELALGPGNHVFFHQEVGSENPQLSARNIGPLYTALMAFIPPCHRL